MAGQNTRSWYWIEDNIEETLSFYRLLLAHFGMRRRRMRADYDFCTRLMTQSNKSQHVREPHNVRFARPFVSGPLFEDRQSWRHEYALLDN